MLDTSPPDDDDYPSELNPPIDRDRWEDCYMPCGCWMGGPCPHTDAQREGAEPLPERR